MVLKTFVFLIVILTILIFFLYDKLRSSFSPQVACVYDFNSQFDNNSFLNDLNKFRMSIIEIITTTKSCFPTYIPPVNSSLTQWIEVSNFFKFTNTFSKLGNIVQTMLDCCHKSFGGKNIFQKYFSYELKITQKQYLMDVFEALDKSDKSKIGGSDFSSYRAEIDKNEYKHLYEYLLTENLNDVYEAMNKNVISNRANFKIYADSFVTPLRNIYLRDLLDKGINLDPEVIERINWSIEEVVYKDIFTRESFNPMTNVTQYRVMNAISDVTQFHIDHFYKPNWKKDILENYYNYCDQYHIWEIESIGNSTATDLGGNPWDEYDIGYDIGDDIRGEIRNLDDIVADADHRHNMRVLHLWSRTIFCCIITPIVFNSECLEETLFHIAVSAFCGGVITSVGELFDIWWNVPDNPDFNPDDNPDVNPNVNPDDNPNVNPDDNPDDNPG